MRDRFIHWSHTPGLDLSDNYDYSGYFKKPFKPQGLWLTDDSEESWQKWCEEADFGCGQCRIDLEVTEEANLLWLKTEDDILRFGDMYGENLSGVPNYKMSVRWGEIAERYHGIMIFPYQPSLRFDVPWYYPWDCASGCVWKPRTALRLV